MAKKFSELTSGAVSSNDYVPTSRGTGNYKVNLVTAITETLPSSYGGNFSLDSGKLARYDASGSLRGSGVISEIVEIGGQSNGKIILRNGVNSTEITAAAVDESWTFGSDGGFIASKSWVSSNFISDPFLENIPGSFTPAAGEVVAGDDTLQSALEKTYYAASSAISASGGVLTGTIQAPGYLYSASAIISNTGNLTLDNSYNGKIILSNNTTPIAYTVASGLSDGFSCSVLQNGTGITTFTGAAGVSLNSYGSLRQIAGQYGSAYLQWVSSNSYILAGNLS